MTTTGDRVLAHLQPYDLKKHGNEWRCNSPLRPGSNSHGFTLRIDPDGEHGAWSDHAGGEGGSLYDLADRLHIERPQSGDGRAPVENSKRAYKDLKEYAAFKGVPAEMFAKAGWKQTTYDKRPALEFPTETGKRYRFLDGNSPPFKSQQGYKACWYGLKIAAGLAKQENLPLVLCNGEPSVVVAMNFRLPACAITGGEQPTLPAPLLDELKERWKGTILIAMDCDAAGRKAAEGKAGILRGAGYLVHVIDLGLGDKGDLADFCKLHGADAMQRLLELAQKGAQAGAAVDLTQLTGMLRELVQARKINDAAAKATLPSLLDKLQSELDHSRLAAQPQMVQSFAHLVSVRHKRLDAARANPSNVQGLRSNLETLDYLIGGFVPGRVYTFYGDTGMGKSTTVASIVAQFAAQAPGFIIPTESMPGDYLDKLAAYKANVPFDLIETGTLDDAQYHRVIGQYSWLEERNCHILDALSPTAATVGTAVRQGVKQHGYQWVLIDSINNLSSLLHDDVYGKTSEAADFAQEMARLGLVVLITSQVGRNLKGRKNKVPRINDALGSGRVEQNSDVVMSVYNHQYYVDREEAKPDIVKFPPGMLQLRCLKHRWRGSAEGKFCRVVFKGGVGVFN